MKKLIVIFTVLLALAGWSSALADTITYNGIQQAGLQVKFKVGYRDYRYANTGEFDISWNEEEVLAAYCTDILSYGVGGSYDVSALSDFDYTIYNNLYRAAWIMENYTPGLGYESGYYSDTVATTAVQAAIWDLLTPGYAYLYYVTSGSWDERNAAKSLYTQILAESQGIDFSSYAFQNMFYFGDSNWDKQDLLFATSSSPGPSVPEPGTMVLMGSALLTGLGLRRRQLVAKIKTLLRT